MNYITVMEPNKYLKRVHECIINDDMAQALSLLRELLDLSPQLDEVIHQSGRHAAIRQQMRLGTVSHADAMLEQNQIRAALLELLHEIDTQKAKSPALEEEVTRAIAVTNAKNTVINSTITAGGDVHIGDKHVTQNASKIYNIDKIDRADFS